MGSFDGLPIDLLQLIAEKIADHADVLRFAVACRRFRSIVMDNLHLLPPKLPLCLCVLPNKPPPIPLLMQCRDNEWENINFFSISDGKNHGDQFVVPEIRNKWLVGSSYGWLCTVEIQGRAIALLNPLTRAQIPLPSLDEFQHHDHDCDDDDFGYLHKVVISSDPSNKRRNLEGNGDGILVMALVSNFNVLSFCRVGDDKWTRVEDCLTHIDDVICYNSQIYGVNYEGIAVVYDIAGDKKMKQIANSPDSLISVQRYLVESTNGDLLQVVREIGFRGDDIYQDDVGICTTIDFSVYKLEGVDKPVKPKDDPPYMIVHRRLLNKDRFKFKWVKVESLGDQALFLGKNYSLCVRAPDYQGCKPNCIYFTEHGLYGFVNIARGGLDDEEIHKDTICDMGIYDLEDESFEDFSQLNVRYLVPPIWISPNPW